MSNCVGVEVNVNENIFEAKMCTHGIIFNEDEAQSLPLNEIRKRWPRLCGKCPLGCGFNGIAYASLAHYLYGDW